MRIDIHAINLPLSAGLKTYAETRIWKAAGRWTRRVAWTGMWLVDSEDMAKRPSLSCRLDAWVRGVGVVTVRHQDTNACAAIDIAAARLEQTIAQKIQRLDRQRLDQTDGPMKSAEAGIERQHIWRPVEQVYDWTVPLETEQLNEQEAMSCG